MRKAWIIGFIVWLSIGYQPSLAQKAPTLLRLEIPSALAPGSYRLAPLAKDGFLIFYRGRTLTENKKRKWYFGLFDKHLKQQWLREIPLPNKLIFVQQQLYQNKLYLLFKNIDRIKRGVGYYELLIYDIPSQIFSETSGKIPVQSQIYAFKISGQTACMAIQNPDFVSDLLFLNLQSGAVKLAHLNTYGKCFFGGLFVKPLGGNFIAVVNYLNTDSAYHHKIFNFSEDAEINQTINIVNKKHNQYLKQFSLASAQNNQLLFLGTYDQVGPEKNSLKIIANNQKARAAGFFSLLIDKEQQKELQFYSFMQFKNIAGTFANSQVLLPRNRKNRKLKQDQEESSVGVSLMNLTPLRLYPYQNHQFVLAAEAFRPYYKTETRMDYDFYGNPFPNTYQVFAGNNYYDLILGGFDREGHLLWDNDFPIKNLMSFTVEQQTSIFVDSTQINLAYVNGGDLISQDINGPFDLDKPEKVSIAMRNKRDRNMESTGNHILHWYGKYFLVYGFQDIKNRASDDQNVRTVFYVNKIALE
jgi:hypothetical protein